jgi:hypothetical protein
MCRVQSLIAETKTCAKAEDVSCPLNFIGELNVSYEVEEEVNWTYGPVAAPYSVKLSSSFLQIEFNSQVHVLFMSYIEAAPRISCFPVKSMWLYRARPLQNKSIANITILPAPRPQSTLLWLRC